MISVSTGFGLYMKSDQETAIRIQTIIRFFDDTTKL